MTTTTARELAAEARNGQVSPSELVDQALDRIARRDDRIGAFLDTDAESARARASELERKRAAGAELGPLFGVPFGLKDNLALAGRPLSCASRILEGFRSSYTATSVAKLLAADAIPIGRCNMDEFAFGSSTEHSAFQVTHNPWNPARIPGGSSGGSAAAVAARMVPFALGSDTGGSVRQPAALCGVTGLKPTYGRISRYGLVAFGSSLDQIGPLTHDAADAELLLAVLAGRDPLDATSIDATFETGLDAGDLNGVRIGLPKQFLDDRCDARVLRAVEAATATLTELGAELREVDLPSCEHAIAAYYLIATSESSSNLARFDGVRYPARRSAETLEEQYLRTRGEGFGDEAKLRILLGVFCLSAGYYDAHYLKALKVRTLIREDFARAFEDVDVIVGPTSPIPPYELGEKLDDPLALYLCDVLTVPASLAGIPAISIPCGFDDDGLPVGMQIHGPALGEDRVFRVAKAYQAATSFHLACPQEIA